jgi:hypothetical protein
MAEPLAGRTALVTGRSPVLGPGLRSHDVPNLFTPETCARLVAWRIPAPAAG